MENRNKKGAGGKPLRTKLAILAVMSVLMLIAVVPMAAGEWYFKPAYPNYAPSGMPDFDQKQDNWMKGGQWTFCGPVAVANCFWWFDSKYADPTGTPGDGVDIFPLVQDYGALSPVWGSDDHDPANVDDAGTPWSPGNELVERLALCMNTDGGPYPGTDVHVMEQCIDDWLDATGLNRTFYEHTVKMPDFYYIGEEIERSQDVILLLGFWEEYPLYSGEWWRIGGHYVTVAGVDSDNLTIALSDPFIDNAVVVPGQGRIVPNPHPPGYTSTFHNDAMNISHDFYGVDISPSPGGEWGIIEYPVYSMVWNFHGVNVPPEFEPRQGEWHEGPIYTEIEYAVLISPLPLTPFLINGWVNCTNGDPVNDPSVTVTNMNTGEVFITETNVSSNYYQIITSSLNVSTGNVLHFVVSDSEFDHPVTQTEMDAGGFERNVTIECGGPWVCGDATGDDKVTMADGRRIYMHKIYGTALNCDPCEADVTGDGKITMADGRRIYMHKIYGTALNCKCP